MSGLENDDVSSKKKRKRSMVSVACENCRSSHLRCDGTTRCSHCCRKNLTCTYSESKRRGRKPIKESSPKKKESIGEVHKDSWKLPTNSPTSNLQSLYDAATGQKMSPTSMINPFAGVQSICIPNYLTIPFAPSQASIQAVITRHIEIYTSYCSFLFPQLQMPLSNHITTQKLHDLAYYAILSLGTLMTQNHVLDGLYTTTHYLAKEIAFDCKGQHTADVYCLLSYLSLVRGNKELASMYNIYASSIYSAYDIQSSHTEVLIAFNDVFSKSKSSKEQLTKLINQDVSEELALISTMYQYFVSEDLGQRSDETLIGALENVKRNIKSYEKMYENKFESLMLNTMLYMTKSHIFMKTKNVDKALKYAKKSVDICNANPEFKYYPYFFIKLLSKIAFVYIGCNESNEVDKVIQCLSSLAWGVPARKAIENIRKKASVFSLLNSNFQSTKSNAFSTMPLPSLYQSQNLHPL